MKKTIIVIILLLLPGAGFASEPDFRKVNWGMSFDEVKKNEAGKPDIDSKQGLIYTVTVGGLDTKLVYNFEDEKLSTATYDFKNTYKKSFYYVTDFDKIDEGLVKKYGEPKAKNTIWFKKIFKDSPESWGTALLLGHFKMTTEWFKKDGITELIHVLMSNDGKVLHAVSYRPYKEETEEQDETINMDDL